MQYFEISIAGGCGIARASSVSSGPILVNHARIISGTMNHVMITMSTKDSVDGLFQMKSDLSNYTSHVADDNIFIDSYKIGHGILKSFLSIDAFLLYPVIASNGTENFRLLSRERDLESRIQDIIGNKNRIDRISSRNVSLSEAFNDHSDFKLQPSLYGLTEKEIGTMKSAISNGYYEWPRRNDLSVISKSNKSSKVTTLYHLRKAEKKIFESIFGKNT